MKNGTDQYQYRPVMLSTAKNPHEAMHGFFAALSMTFSTLMSIVSLELPARIPMYTIHRGIRANGPARH